MHRLFDLLKEEFPQITFMVLRREYSYRLGADEDENVLGVIIFDLIHSMNGPGATLYITYSPRHMPTSVIEAEIIVEASDSDREKLHRYLYFMTEYNRPPNDFDN